LILAMGGSEELMVTYMMVQDIILVCTRAWIESIAALGYKRSMITSCV
jgi:hypothetical protein